MKFDGPIPGENITSDRRNYPWHRPPQFDTLEECLDHAFKHMRDKKAVKGLLFGLDTGITVAAMVDMYVTAGIAKGKWSVDQAILMAGPMARMVEIIAKQAGIKYDMGVERVEEDVTPVFLKAMANKSDVTDTEAKKSSDAVEENTDDVIAAAEQYEGGLMAPSPEQEQQMMLGFGDEEMPIEEEVL